MNGASRPCHTCVASHNHNGRPHIVESAIYNPEDGNSYCSRHRCTLPGCTRPRDGFSLWWCKNEDHKSGAMAPSKDASNGTPNDPPQPQDWVCGTCTVRVEDLDMAYSTDGLMFYSQHRCSVFGCGESRYDLTPWCKLHQDAKGREAADNPAPSQSLSNAVRKCQVCDIPFTDMTNTVPQDGPGCCSRHRCNHQGCYKPRAGNAAIFNLHRFKPFASGRQISNLACAEHSPHTPTPSATQSHFRRCEACGASIKDINLPAFPSGVCYCAPHRCTHPGCPKPRVEIFGELTWFCEEGHLSTPLLPSQPGTRTATPPLVSPISPKPPKPTTPDPPPCEACVNVKAKTGFDSKCSRHRCTWPGCSSPRADSWHCSSHLGWEDIRFPPKATPVAPTPPTKQRHSRVRSLLNWKPLLRNRKDSRSDPDTLPEPPPPTETETKEPPIKQPPRYSTIIQEECTTLLEKEQHDAGWHQCHATACQDRVLSEEVWVCQKHLDQGFYDPDDPPGFMDSPV